MTKAELRWWAREQQKQTNHTVRETLWQCLRELSEWKTATHVLLYLAMPHEISVEAVMGEEDEKQWYVPRCAPDRRLAVHPYVPGETPLRRGPFGIREPDPEQTPEADPTVLDLVIVPALLYAPDGSRLGYGGGYYDRFLLRLRPDCVCVGLLPDEQIVPALPLDPWDKPVDIIVTPTQVIRSECSRYCTRIT